MSTKTQNKIDDQEIDLVQLSKKIGDFFDGMLTKIFKGILFLKRNIRWVGILFIIGSAIGYYLDITKKIYNSEVVVISNFDSSDYLYSKMDLINAKIKEGDMIFLKKEVGIEEPEKLKNVEIAPIIDVYKFITDDEKNFDFIKLWSENTDINEIIIGDITAKNYPFHLIALTTLDKTARDKTVEPLLKYLNDSDYYNQIREENLNNVKIKMIENDSIISQINGFLNSFSDTVNGSQKSDKLVYYNENSQLNEVIKTKDELIKDQGKLRLNLVDYDRIIKEKSNTLNIRNTQVVNGKMKLVLPIAFIFMFILGGYFNSLYRRQMQKLNN
ncbi:MAG: hypothetical protein ACI7YS_16540 [Flavobacterium sp.]